MQKWEYFCQFGHEGEEQRTEEELNRLGKDGWELVLVVRAPGGSMGAYWLKRPVS